MSDTGMAPFDPVRVLGCTPGEAAKLMHGQTMTLVEVEALALSSYQWWRHLRDPRSYWVTASQASGCCTSRRAWSGGCSTRSGCPTSCTAAACG